MYRSTAIITAILVAFGAVAARAGEPAPGISGADSASTASGGARAAGYSPAAPDCAQAFSPSARSPGAMFRGDGAGFAEMLRYRSLASVFVPYALSSGKNRLLPYGNPAPDGYGAYIRDDYFYHPDPGALTGPEFRVFWENGPFGGNTLNLSLARPLGASLTASLFSNYRYSGGTQFDHEGNDIANFYKFFYADSSAVMNRGYNPLSDEHIMGLALSWRGAGSSERRLSFSFVNTQNEYALGETVTASAENLEWALSGRALFRANAGLLGQKLGPLNVDLSAAFISESDSSFNIRSPAAANGKGEAKYLTADAKFTLPFNLGLSGSGMYRNARDFGGDESSLSVYSAGLFYTLRLSAGWAGAEFRARGGATFTSDGDTLLYSPCWGIETEAQAGYTGLLAGYQYTAPSRAALIETWDGYPPPYPQPLHTFVIAPWMSRYRGLSLLSRAIITDTKPYIKAAAALSYLIQPQGMAYTFEPGIGFDYWSGRAPVIFAGHTEEWRRPVYDLNVKVTVHIREFRLFYKIDNLLNIKQAYIPGYFSPGLTFRWGLNWFIQ
ncbi:MAG: hypothetical protein FWB85_01750 [Chitinispirillia bacterium]|nr:hypothetical protein [Chitinispirillia bacterium]MCL2241121.1 hypothetical protein [Chitinispirillia bacterium]